MKSLANPRLTKRIIAATSCVALTFPMWNAGAIELWPGKLSLHGSFQTDILIPENDDKIGSTTDDGKFNTNTYLDLWLQGSVSRLERDLSISTIHCLGSSPVSKDGVYPISMQKGSRSRGLSLPLVIFTSSLVPD